LVRIEAYRFRLAANEYFVLGDNRPVSMDSRAIGPVKRNDIKGKMIFRIW
jgi:signal peptidase I